MMKAPTSVPVAVPMPPEKLVPPMMEAVIASNSKPIPAFGKPALTRDMKSTPESPTKAPLMA